MGGLEYQLKNQEKESYVNFNQNEEIFFEKIIGNIDIGAFGSINYFVLNNYEELRKRLIREKISDYFLESSFLQFSSNYYYDSEFLKQIYSIKMGVTQLVMDSIKSNLDSYAKMFFMSLTARMYELHNNYYVMLSKMMDEDMKIFNDLQSKTKKKVNYS